ncbi:dTDP-4-dehydrorhamnose 3,5-epimerase [Belliella buryatensis]|uniref:dTDP-4-dehydrorhamnose 3,5-epimerase n=1 Tax=Belliella buryatensis TaxID=1500549 RepID=A0A239EAH5_9BACT|nr:dTDP-4-dehydrorhamnose 3,5-epimerase [Belliella buryatensis]SNS41499.1 dTDP-4-dehydrorhamnose 3,5-epimerase [Belliella buryatensis]
MKTNATPIAGLIEITPKVFEDSRGYFFESFRKESLEKEGVKQDWVQENQSFSKKGTIRGLHFQAGDHAQAKLVSVIQGKVLDVVLDLRKDSISYGAIFTVILDAEKHNMLYIPEGFAHGFSVLEDAIFTYKCSAYYHKESEGGILWNDPKLMIDWKVESPILSEKDQLWPTLEKFTKEKGGL